MPTSRTANVDFTQGRAFLHEGVLYYSPNSKRSIIIRESPSSDPFVTKKKMLLSADMFTQPCWWTSSWGWMSFIPLAPSFTSTPFEPFCWMPRIEETWLWVKGIDGTETRETRFKMADVDIQKWKAREQQIVEAANKIRLIHGITHGISANFPPTPSDFHYDCPHRSFRVARRMITLARDWFAIWMGILGFLIAQASKLPMKNCPKPPAGFPVELPPWYWLLNTTMDYSPSWLDGLLSSSVVDPECARTGVIYRLSDRDRDRPLPFFFLDHNVPIWFPWTSVEEYAVKQNPSLLPFAPPSFLLQEALTMLEGIDADEMGIVRTHPNDFILARERRQREVIESQQDVQRRRSREQKPPTKNTTMYEWIKHALPGGQDVYVRVRVSKANQSSTYSMYGKRDRIYNAMSNEWDFSEEFSRPTPIPGSHDNAHQSDDENDSGGDDDDYFYNNDDYDHRITYHSPQVVSVSQTTSNEHEDSLDQVIDYSPSRIPWSCDVLETMARVYGYVPVLKACDMQRPSAANWQELLAAVGFGSNLPALAIDEDNQSSMWHFFSSMIANRRPLFDFYDLEEENRAALKSIVDFKEIQRPTQDLFIFSTPPSAACDWVLGVDNPSAVLYAIRYILAHRTISTSASGSTTTPLTIVGVAAHLLERGIPFRTLLPLRCSSRSSTITKAYTPSIFRDLAHPFDVSDFEEAMLQCKSLLSSPRGRAAILMGGIVGRIAKEYISVDAVLHGPSIEITTHHVGYFGPSASGDRRYCDDELTEHEIAVICGTYTMYTGRSSTSQNSSASWLPPPSAWCKNGAGFRWLEWTERSESFFVQLLQDIQAGKARPLSVADWRSRLRGLKSTRDLLNFSNEQARRFMNEQLPVHVS
ncbi:hypothetical protein BJ912DRAFT_867269 [Pholiota molesta]|nr:hypothetical protein BJ912DRAFT_867269 [Pholiota molesta]